MSTNDKFVMSGISLGTEIGKQFIYFPEPINVIITTPFAPLAP